VAKRFEFLPEFAIGVNFLSAEIGEKKVKMKEGCKNATLGRRLVNVNVLGGALNHGRQE